MFKATSPYSLHVVSLQVPFPPDYGGVIDIYYKLKALKEAGVSIWLHTWQYERKETAELEQIADHITYYPRDCSIRRQLSLRPYIVESRQHKELITNLLTDNAPILFEGLHCCAILNDKRLKNRLKLVRTHNVEHEYYQGLADKSSGWKSFYYKLEASRLKRYEKVLSVADVILAITESDQRYFASKYPTTNTVLLPAFHAHTSIKFPTESSDYLLYHGNLSVEENIEAATYLLQHVAPLTPSASWIFAGKNPSDKIIQAIANCPQARLIANPSEVQMDDLISHAKANVLISSQPTGLKLKLLHALYLGGTCIVNSPMLEGTNLASTCVVADTLQALASAINQALNTPFTPQQYTKREKALAPYDNRANAQIIVDVIRQHQ